MNLNDNRYSDFSLCREMLETVDIIRRFDPSGLINLAETLTGRKKMLITGEGSSRIFPAKHAIYWFMKSLTDRSVSSEGCLQAMEYNLDDYNVVGLSNSGRTHELLSLFDKLRNEHHPALFSITSYAESPVSKISVSQILGCGTDNAVAATKSVVEQALVLQVIISFFAGNFSPLTSEFRKKILSLAIDFEKILTADLPADFISKFSGATKIYFAGRNNGVAEELALKTNEITRKKSMFLEGTFLLHGIEEAIESGELLVLINPWKSQEEKIKKVVIGGVKIPIIAISSRKTAFPTIVIPENEDLQCYNQLAAGWNLLVEAGLNMGINIDKGIRGQKNRK